MTQSKEPKEESSQKSKIENDVKHYLDTGDVFHAYNLALQGLETDQDNIKLREYAALALLRTGAVEEAKILISYIGDLSKIKDAETLGLVAHVYRESWYHSREPEDLTISYDLYTRLFQDHKELQAGTYALWTSWLLGKDQDSETFAEQIIKMANQLKEQHNKEGIEAHIALFECYLLRGELDLAEALLNRVQALAGKAHPTLIVELLRKLKFLSEQGFLISKNIFDILKPPTIVVFAGQPIDFPGEKIQSFVPELEKVIKERIKETLQRIDARIGYSSASCGSDLLFIEAMREIGGEVNIILPFDKTDFLENSVSYAGPRWEARFFEATEKATSVKLATDESYLGHDMLYRFGNLMLHGMAEMRGNFLLSPPHLVSVWDSVNQSLAGGASDFIDHWPDIRTLHLIDLDEVRSTYFEENPYVQLPPHLKTIRPKRVSFYGDLRGTPRTIKTMLFADLSGFSKLKEENIPGFLSFLRELKSTMEIVAPPVESLNTWGDAIFAVSSKASDLAEYALRLSEMVPDISKNTRGLPPINVRVSLHAGPVYESEDPFRKVTNFYGGHINRAARLEPVTVVGQVYTTEQFMSLLTSEQGALRTELGQQGLPYIQKYTSEYVGVVQLAKNFGTQPVYHLRWL